MARLDYKMEPFFFTPPRNKMDKTLHKDSPEPAAAPTSQTVTNTSIPEYARPYVERMLGKTEALTDINKNPYQTYGGQRIADFSPMQQKAFGNVANMQTAGQLGGATNLAGMSGLGSIGTAGQMAGVGNQYNRMATNPNAVSAFMNPYLQESLAPQLAEIQRNADITGMGLQGQATQQGAFGGNRAALQQSENQRNALNAKQQAIGQGYNTAFQNAQQAQQFGANLGLQGLQGALSGFGQAGAAAGTLGQLGQTQFGQEQAINAAQQQVGAVQQAQAQQNLDQRYQDFLKQQNYPYQQLAFMSDMTRGLPLSQSAQQQYTAPPSMVSQLGGLGMAGLGIYGASGGFKAKGGMIEDNGYKAGGSINLKDEEELNRIITDPTSNPLEVASAEEQLMLRNRIHNNPQARVGLGAIATGDTVPEEFAAAGGGIVAFKSGNKVESKAPDVDKARMAKLEADIASYSDKLMNQPQFTKSDENQKQIAADMAARKERMPYDILTSAGLGAMAGTSPYALTNFGTGGQQGLKTAQQIEAENAADRKLAMQNATEQEKAEFARKSGMLNTMQTSYGQMVSKDIGLMNAKAAGAQANALKEQTMFLKAQQMRLDAIAKAKQNLFQQNKAKYNMDYSSQELDAEAVKMVDAQLSPQMKTILGMGGMDKPAKAEMINGVDTTGMTPEQIKTAKFLASQPQAAAPASSAPATSSAKTKINPYQAGIGPKQLTSEQQQALSWAKANPDDPRSAIIKQRIALGA